jgi:Tn3 transposase DDE domain
MAARFPHAGPLLTGRLDEDLIVSCRDDLLRMAGSLKFGQATASPIAGKWPAASPQNTRAAALKERGLLQRTIYAARYLSDPAYRRTIARQLNRGESLHALRRDLHYANQGSIGAAHQGEQTEQAWCLTLLTSADHLDDRVLPAGRRAATRLAAARDPMKSWRTSPQHPARTGIEAELAKLDACSPAKPGTRE